MKRRHVTFLFLCLVAPVLMGGYGGDDGCSCGDDWGKPSRTVVPTFEEASAPVECLVFIDAARRESEKSCSQTTCQTCVIDDADLKKLKRDLASARQELAQLKQQLASSNAELKLLKSASVVKNPRFIKTVTVKRGWWMGKYVKATRGADPKATRLCNGFTSLNPKIHPGQRIKICGW